MRLLTKKLPNSHNIFKFGDKHDGSSLSSNTGWLKLCDLMNSEYDGCKNNYGVELGDDIEAITPDDKRFSPDRLTEKLVLAQMREAVRLRQPIKHMMLFKLMGNHERKLWGIGDIMSEMCDQLGVEYGTWSTKLSIHDKKDRLMYKLFATHGSKSINSTADDPKRRTVNMELILKRHLKFKAGDCAVMVKGHTHKLLVCKPESELYLTDNGEQIRQAYTHFGQNEGYIPPDQRWYGNTGSFLKLYGEDMSSYSEIAEYDPTELGFLVLKVRDKKIISLDKVILDI
jgi:hypothetical protein